MLLIKIFLSALHLGALTFFALKYLRFDVKSTNDSNSADIPDNLKQKINEIIEKNSETKQPKFDRFVYFLLDAWRWNFLFSEATNMEFLKSKITEGEAVGFVSLARIPTVTKPCLKSIFSGTHPVFFEIVENIDESGVTETVQSSTATTQDNLLQRLKGKGKKIAVYGDDVWGKLFPLSTFHRHDIAFGFNIMDYTEVDNLVHRGFEREKNAEEPSDVIILHYLGLDHIGHSYAAKLEYVEPKLKEMDAKIKEIYEWIARKDAKDGKKSLILMMGDHGMTNDGNHGGGSRDETQAAAVFMSPHFQNNGGFSDWRDAVKEAEAEAHNQENLAATLTALLDGSSPLKFGTGCLIKRVMRAANLEEGQERVLLLKNLIHLLSKSTGKQLNFDFDIDKLTNEQIYEISLELKNNLNADSFTFEERKLKFAALALSFLTVVYASFWFKGMKMNLESLTTILAISIISACQSATSFIGEEHLLWQTSFAVIFIDWVIKNNNYSVLKTVKILMIHRILCGWNGVGSLWVNEWTLSSWIKSHDAIEAASVAISLIWIVSKVKRQRGRFAVLALSSVLVFLHRIGLKGGVPSHLLAQAVLALLIISFSMKNIEISAAILFVLVNKPMNALPVALILELTQEINELEKRFEDSASLFLRMCLMQCSYYALGLWNSVSAIDLTFGAIFSKNFDMRTAPIVLLLYCWSGPILVALTTRKRPFKSSAMAYDTLFIRGVLDASACIFAFHHRFHAWVFDFFSPKILFQIFWAVFYILIFPLINI